MGKRGRTGDEEGGGEEKGKENRDSNDRQGKGRDAYFSPISMTI